MTRAEQIQRLTQLLGSAPGVPSADPDARDADWPIECADYLRKHAGVLLPHSLGRAQLIKVLIELDNEHAARAADRPWPEFLARTLVERYVEAPQERLQLFISRGCGFCTRVLRVIDELHIDIQLRDIYADPDAYRELVTARGRATVPVLRCTAGEVDRFMPESADIIRYLRRRFGESR